ncbi:venom phosphodiesterase CdcPDE [Synchiropus picturatus]
MQLPPHSRKILIGLLAVAIVTIILGLGIGLGVDLQRCRDKVEPQTSCANRCNQPFNGNSGDCRCDENCKSIGNCCFDYQDICMLPAEQWGCTRLRCGEKRLTKSKCHCSDDCRSQGDCCTNYLSVCHGEPEWVDGECDDLTEQKCPAGFKRQPLLLVSLDGLRAEYLQTWNVLSPVLDKLKKCGTSTPYMQSAFPTKTFPNHYTIVTGLYPESNGLIDNSMYDPVLDATFSLGSDEKNNPAWYLGQPVWHTAKYQGLKAGTFFWPGSDVKINGSFPNIYQEYNGSVEFEERVFTVLKWLQLPEDQRPDFYTLYIEEPDKSGHSFGPVSGGVVQAILGVDIIIRQLMNGLKLIGLHRCVNIIVVADHGMEETSCERTEDLQSLIGDVSKFWVTQGPFGRIRTKNKDDIVDWPELVAKMACKAPDQKIRPYLKSHLPKRLHFANSRRIEEVSVLVTPRWQFESSPGSLTFCEGGAHGYDNDADSMNAIFLGYGPKFWNQTEVEPFSNIELYNLMCDLLQISPADNNGTHGSMNHLLRMPFFTPAPPAELSAPLQCPLQDLNPPENLGCSCPALEDNAINERLNLTQAEVSAAEATHLTLGRPRLLQANHDYCVLHHQGFVSAFSHRNKMPLWTSYSVDQEMSLDRLPPVMPNCLRPDVRLPQPQSPRCDEYDGARNLTYGFLFPPNLNSSAEQQYDALMTSNLIPIYPQFKKVWDHFHNSLLPKYGSVFKNLNVLTGPAFDYNYDGRADSPEQIQQFVFGTKIPVPTHFFIVLTSCEEPLANCTDLQSLSFLLPHRDDNSEICNNMDPESAWVEDHMWFHQCRVRDVEWITGLDLYQAGSQVLSERLRMKTRPTVAFGPKP